MATMARIHAAPDEMKSLAKPTKKSFWMITVPLSPMSRSTTPFQANRPASVTTNDGMPILVMISPCRTPIAAPAPSATTSAGPAANTLWLSGKVSRATITPATPLT